MAFNGFFSEETYAMLQQSREKTFSPSNSSELEDIKRQLSADTLSGVEVNSSTAMRIAAVHTCVKILAEGVAQIPIHIYRRRKDGRGKERATDHPLYNLLHDSGSPNEWQSSYEFKEHLQATTTIRGNAYGFISRAGDRVLEVLPLNPERMQVDQDKDFNVRYRYNDTDGKQVLFRKEDIFHLRGLSSNGLTGVNPIQLQRESLGVAKAAERHGAAYFGNYTMTGGVLSSEQNVSEEKMTAIKKGLQEGFTKEKAFRPLVLDGGFKWNPYAMSNEDAQFLETRKFQAREIFALFRVPPHLAGDLERATFSNIEEQSLEFVIYTLMPWFKRWEGVINKRLFAPQERGEYFAEFMVDALLRGDFETRVRGYGQMINWGIMSPNEAREKENLNPRDGGDIYLTPVNMTSNPDAAPAKKKGTAK